jgi:flavin reductase (DIM6/NTAB) family NADH-FMN oxidoreductase RutF
VDKKTILALARTWAATVTVVTVRRRPDAITPEAPEVDGFTATAFMILSLEPPLVAIGVGRDSGADDLLEDADFLAVNLLSEGQSELSHAFARHHRDRGMPGARFLAEDALLARRCSRGPPGVRRHRRAAVPGVTSGPGGAADRRGDTERTLVYQTALARLTPL